MRNLAALSTAVLSVVVSPMFATVQVHQLQPSLTSPRPIGTTVVWTATASDSNPGPLVYQFSAGMDGQLHVLRDYALSNTFSFTPVMQEGVYEVQVIARDPKTGESATLTANFTARSRVLFGQPAVNATPNPLVALYSAPSCPAGSDMAILFFQRGTTDYERTDWRACNAKASNNFYIAGLRAATTYEMVYQVRTGASIASGPRALSFRTGTPTETFPTITLPIPATSQADPAEKMVLHSFVPSSAPIATDRAGRLLWFYKSAMDGQTNALLTRLVNHGTLLLLANGPGYAYPNVTSDQILREIDLAGNTVRETNASWVSAQLLAMGAGPMTSFSHDAIRLPNGNTVVLGSTEKIFPAGTQGSTAPVDIIGDVIVVLDANWQVIWFWNAFDSLDINRKAILGETCTPNQPGCPPILLASIANDWLHGNSLDYLPSEGNLLYSSRHQDWLIKIDYNNGAGTKNVLWRMGPGGDFTMTSGGPFPWFSHQHNASFEQNGTSVLTLFDDGNTRVAPPPVGLGPGNSRGQVLNVDQTNMTVSLALNVDLGVYSAALGSAQRTVNGDHMFQPGTIAGTTDSQTIEVLPDGTQVFNQQAPTSYRSFLLPNLYNPPNN